MAAVDCRFSMADSEWSRDDSEEDRYAMHAIPNVPVPRPRSMYDVPPDVEERVMLPSVGEDQEFQNDHQLTCKGKRATNHSKEQQPTTNRKPAVKCWAKIYFVILTIAVLALAGVLTYLILSAKDHTDRPPSPKRGRIAPNSSSELEELKLRTTRLESVLDRILDLLVSPEIREKNVGDDTEIGCLEGDIKFDTKCYSITTVNKPVMQYKAAINCISVKKRSTLAIIQSLEIQNALRPHLPTGMVIWIDGRKQTDSATFQCSDKSLMLENSWRNFTGSGNCLAYDTSSDQLAWKKASCYDAQTGYICQYDASKPADAPPDGP